MRRVLPLVVLLVLAAPASGARGGGEPVALVTAETLNQLIAVDLPTGHILRRLQMPADPENVAGRPGVGTAVVVSSRAGTVSLVDVHTLRIVRRLGGFRSPHIAAITPNGRYAYVTDDARGKLVVIDLRSRREVSHVFIGFGAHHLTISPDGRRTWIALGEQAHRIMVFDTSRPTRPRVVGQIHLHRDGHDVAFTPSGSHVWVTHSSSSRVTVFDARIRRPLESFEAGPPPQHVAFLGRRAYVTSGYGGRMQFRNARTGQLLRTVPTDYGSFNIGLGGGLVLTSSLLRGTLTELNNLTGRRIGQWHLAPATRNLALVVR